MLELKRTLREAQAKMASTVVFGVYENHRQTLP